ncbi:Uncharacterised protein [Bordetella pertussis]|nr:Uncharacterised protein [Bordetella pertussis]
MHQVAFLVPAGQENDRHGKTVARAQPAHDFVAIHVGQLPVEQDEVERLDAQRRQQVEAARIAGTCVSGRGEHLLDMLRLVQIVFERRNFHSL